VVEVVDTEMPPGFFTRAGSNPAPEDKT